MDIWEMSEHELSQINIWEATEHEMSLPHILVEKPQLPELCMWRALSYILTKDHRDSPDVTRYTVVLDELIPADLKGFTPAQRKREAKRISGLIQALTKHEGNSLTLNLEQANRYFSDDYAGGVSIFERSGVNEQGEVLLVLTQSFKQILSHPDIAYISGDYEECRQFKHTKSFNWYWRTIFQVLRNNIEEETIRISDLHNIFNSTENYRKNFALFRTNVLDKVYEDLKSTRAAFVYEIVKEGRRVGKITFRYTHAPLALRLEEGESNDPNQLLLELEEDGHAYIESKIQDIAVLAGVQLDLPGIKSIVKRMKEERLSEDIVLMRIALAVRYLTNPVKGKRINHPEGFLVASALKSDFDESVFRFVDKKVKPEEIALFKKESPAAKTKQPKAEKPASSSTANQPISIKAHLTPILGDFINAGRTLHSLDMVVVNGRAEAEYVLYAVKYWVEDNKNNIESVDSAECQRAVWENQYLKQINKEQGTRFKGFV